MGRSGQQPFNTYLTLGNYAENKVAHFIKYRIYRLADVDFGSKISHADRVMYYSESRTIDGVPGSGCGTISVKEELWSATVKGRTVAVKTYKGPLQVSAWMNDSTLNAGS